MASLRIFIADHINFIHKLISYFVVFGCLLPTKYLIIHLSFMFLLYTHWYLNDNYCFFSMIEYVLRGKEVDLKTIDKMIVSIQTEYKIFKFIALKLFNYSLTIKDMHLITVYLTNISIIISLIRFISQFDFFKKLIENLKKLIAYIKIKLQNVCKYLANS